MQVDYKQIIAEVLADIAPEADLDEIEADEPLREELDIDSMDFLKLVTGIAERTGVEIPEADYPKVSTLEELIAYLEGGGG
ncbi:MAG: acyl carrier protein [Alphaproteobacteria bacterium]|nr:acyl carrier protein [Alphaproteobacteria bacterium]